MQRSLIHEQLSPFDKSPSAPTAWLQFPNRHLGILLQINHWCNRKTVPLAPVKLRPLAPALNMTRSFNKEEEKKVRGSKMPVTITEGARWGLF